MIKVTRRGTVEAATPEQIFAALNDPQGIAQMLPRVTKVELSNVNEAAGTAKLVTHMALGGIFGTIRCEGDLSWMEPTEIVFKVRTPMPLETRWTLTPKLEDTEVAATMFLDLAPMLGAMAAFVPVQQVAEMLSKELDSALKAVMAKCSGADLRERAIAA
jgi:carbon monoxide dehydrogenase subunit G